MEQKRILLLVGAAVAVALFVWLLPIRTDEREALIVQPVSSDRVIWEGSIIGIMESGAVLAVERSDGSGAFAGLLREPLADVSEGVIRISGIPGERSCAYRNTVFAGECVVQLFDAVIDGSTK